MVHGYGMVSLVFALCSFFYVTNRILPIKEALHTVNRYSYHYLIYSYGLFIIYKKY